MPISIPQLFLVFFNGAASMAALVSSLFFVRFWRSTSDRFFGLFALGFLILAIERAALLASNGMEEADPLVYLFRCIGFIIIIFAVVDKNRTPPDA